MHFKTIIKNSYGHFKTIITHKWWVFYYGCMLGIPVRAFFHDFSKFNPIEFCESVKYYQGGTSSPIPAAKADKGWSKAWQHHKARNKHHYEYWTDNYDRGTTCIKMPYKYVIEMVADFLAAGRTYYKEGFTYAREYEWWIEKRKVAKMHRETAGLIEMFLFSLASPGKGKLPCHKYAKIMYSNGYFKNNF